jgi:DNA-binding CsgD family transcriptional regulator
MPLRRAPDVLSDEEWNDVVAHLGLSRREAEMVRQANYDESVAAIAAALHVSPNTVHTYRERLYRKLGVDSFCQVIAVLFGAYAAIRAGRANREPKSLRAEANGGAAAHEEAMSPAEATPR